MFLGNFTDVTVTFWAVSGVRLDAVEASVEGSQAITLPHSGYCHPSTPP
jgi:hypothetical protein